MLVAKLICSSATDDIRAGQSRRRRLVRGKRRRFSSACVCRWGLVKQCVGNGVFRVESERRMAAVNEISFRFRFIVEDCGGRLPIEGLPFAERAIFKVFVGLTI